MDATSQVVPIFREKWTDIYAPGTNAWNVNLTNGNVNNDNETNINAAWAVR